MGRISHTNLKIRMMISRIATSKNHIELLVPSQIGDRIRDPELALFRFCKQKYQKGFIHRKLKVPTPAILRRP
jgi:hypothetical protein